MIFILHGLDLIKIQVFIILFPLFSTCHGVNRNHYHHTTGVSVCVCVFVCVCVYCAMSNTSVELLGRKYENT